MVPNIYSTTKHTLRGAKKKIMTQKWPHLEFHSIFNQEGTNKSPTSKKKILQFKGQREKILKKKEETLYSALPRRGF